MSNKKIPLSYTILYAKGWYEKSDNLIEDLKETLRLDDYTPFSKNDVLSILIRNYQEYSKKELIDIISTIHPDNVWKVSYPGDKEWDLYDAVVYYILSYFRFLNNNEWEIKTPNYRGKLKRNPDIEVKTIIKYFNNK